MVLSSTSQSDGELSGVALSLRQVGKRYRGRQAVHVDALDVADNTSLNFIGPNGSGKSTLLRIMSGATSPSYGRVAHGAGPMRIVFVPQTGGFYPSLTLLENVETVARLYGVALVDDDRAIEGLYELGLTDMVDRRVGELSGGFQRLAAIAIAFAVKPNGVLLDEPFTALDPEKTSVLHEFLKQTQQELRFLVVSGHDGALAQDFGQSIRFSDGRVDGET